MIYFSLSRSLYEDVEKPSTSSELVHLLTILYNHFVILQAIKLFGG